jgi:starch synthase
LSGINIPIGDDEKPLVIKVASIPNARLQVYFIDNDDYFHRKSVFHDKEDNFHPDNDESAIFFCKGVLETVKKLGWSPDIVHCNDWMTGLIPLYLKTTYKNDPIFNQAKSVFSVYNNRFDYKFDANIVDKAKMLDVDESMLDEFSSADYNGFINIGMKYADTVIHANNFEDAALEDMLKDKSVEQIAADEESIEKYHELWTDLIK